MDTTDPQYALEQALRAFEPVFWVAHWGDESDRLYDPDGTLYAICLDGPVVVATERRRVTVQRGDLVILPPALAVEVTPPARWFGLVYSGPYPYHFRERFIQVWGFEHVSLQGTTGAADARDLRHRLYVYANTTAVDPEPNAPLFHIRLSLPDSSASAHSFSVEWSPPGLPLAQSDDAPNGRTIYLDIPSEATYLTHRDARPAPNPARTMSPEYRPERD